MEEIRAAAVTTLTSRCSFDLDKPACSDVKMFISRFAKTLLHQLFLIPIDAFWEFVLISSFITSALSAQAAASKEGKKP